LFPALEEAVHAFVFPTYVTSVKVAFVGAIVTA
jgi:hypothetical protein